MITFRFTALIVESGVHLIMLRCLLEAEVFLNPVPKRQILNSSKLKDLADDNFKFDVNGRKFSKCVESTVGKGEIARHEQFLLFL